MSLDLDDWSAYLMQAEIQLKALEHGLLHQKYDGLQERATAAKKSIDKTMAWVARQGSAKGVDVLEILHSNVAALPDSSLSKTMLVVCIQEIEQLRAERQFWLRSGFDIGKSGQEVKP